MQLAEWLKAKGVKRRKFAEEIGVSPSMVTDYCDGRCWPGKERVEAIVRATAGEVTANDWLSDDARAKIEAAQC